MSMRTLNVSINGQQVGELREQGGVWALQYNPAWLADTKSFALSPHLPLQPDAIVDGASVRPVQWYFDNLLPEEGQRQLLSADARLNDADAFALLAWYGAESAGSLILLPPDMSATQQYSERQILSDAELSRRINQLPHVALVHESPKRMSLAGAQHKLAVEWQHGKLYEPIGQRASSHILKPAHPDPSYPHSVVNEWFTMELARAMGLLVPVVYRHYVPEAVYLIARFDRVQHGDAWARSHVIDACQLLGLDRSFKYSQGSVEALAKLARACRSPALARTRLFAWLVFNILTGNSDAHLKNLSFQVSHDGVQLAPHYDLLSVAIYDSPAFEQFLWPTHTRLAWPILQAHCFSELNRALLWDAASILGIQRATADRMMTGMCKQIESKALALYKQFEAEAERYAQAGLGIIWAGEARCIRAIIYNVIREMVKKLT